MYYKLFNLGGGMVLIVCFLFWVLLRNNFSKFILYMFFFRVFLFFWLFINLFILEVLIDWKCKDVFVIVCFFVGIILSWYWEKGKYIIIDFFDFNVINGFINFKFWWFYYICIFFVDFYNCIFRNFVYWYNVFLYIMFFLLFYILNKGLLLL